jgi:hypothetical protein
MNDTLDVGYRNSNRETTYIRGFGVSAAMQLRHLPRYEAEVV